jgi:hypothetical protein
MHRGSKCQRLLALPSGSSQWAVFAAVFARCCRAGGLQRCDCRVSFSRRAAKDPRGSSHVARYCDYAVSLFPIAVGEQRAFCRAPRSLTALQRRADVCCGGLCQVGDAMSCVRSADLGICVDGRWPLSVCARAELRRWLCMYRPQCVLCCLQALHCLICLIIQSLFWRLAILVVSPSAATGLPAA